MIKNESVILKEDLKKLIVNFFSLSTIKILKGYLLPLLTFPYLIRVLGIEKCLVF